MTYSLYFFYRFFVPFFFIAFIHSFIHSFSHSFIHCLYCLHSFIHSVIHSLPSFIHSFIHSFINSFIHSFFSPFLCFHFCFPGVSRSSYGTHQGIRTCRSAVCESRRRPCSRRKGWVDLYKVLHFIVASRFRNFLFVIIRILH